QGTRPAAGAGKGGVAPAGSAPGGSASARSRPFRLRFPGFVRPSPYASRFEFGQLAPARPLVQQDPADQPGNRQGRDGIGGRNIQGMSTHGVSRFTMRASMRLRKFLSI